MVADAAEFKFIWDYPDAIDQLPSSSLFKTHPTKLDLSLANLDFLFLQVLKPLLEINLSVLQATPLEVDLLTTWEQATLTSPSLTLQTSLKQAIAQL